MTMKNVLLAGAMVLAGIGHNGPPSSLTQTVQPVVDRAVLPKRVIDENRRNQKLKQKLRRQKRRQFNQKYVRFARKTIKFGAGYRPGKLFKGHRI